MAIELLNQFGCADHRACGLSAKQSLLGPTSRRTSAHAPQRTSGVQSDSSSRDSSPQRDAAVSKTVLQLCTTASDRPNGLSPVLTATGSPAAAATDDCVLMQHVPARSYAFAACAFSLLLIRCP
jgi:hypothetical protein